ncbi:MAG: hypothetical protein ACT4PJ_13835 [Gemmatimonadaceae bacterium]
MRRVHKRVWTAAEDGYVRWDGAVALADVSCVGIDVAAAASRRGFAVDPWGTAYWLVVDRDASDPPDLVVYSFDPNRRRDGETGRGGGDDILARAPIVSPRQ